MAELSTKITPNPFEKMEYTLNVYDTYNVPYFDGFIINTINESLKFDFLKTLSHRTNVKNTNMIIAYAIDYRNLHMHENPELTEKHFNEKIINIIHKSISTPDDILEQFKCWQSVRHGDEKKGKYRKRNLPRILRSAWKTWYEKNLNEQLVTVYLKKSKIRNMINILHCDPRKNATIGAIMGIHNDIPKKIKMEKSENKIIDDTITSVKPTTEDLSDVDFEHVEHNAVNRECSDENKTNVDDANNDSNRTSVNDESVDDLDGTSVNDESVDNLDGTSVDNLNRPSVDDSVNNLNRPSVDNSADDENKIIIDNDSFINKIGTLFRIF